MPNIHTPQRLDGETFRDYRDRRKNSRFAAEALTLNGLATGRSAPSSRQQLRDAQRRNGTMGKRKRFADVFTAHLARKRAEAMSGGYRDQHGAFTLVGKRDFFTNQTGRKWLAGVSAQRGY